MILATGYSHTHLGVERLDLYRSLVDTGACDPYLSECIRPPTVNLKNTRAFSGTAANFFPYFHQSVTLLILFGVFGDSLVTLVVAFGFSPKIVGGDRDLQMM